jgi:hypothetical protein
MIALVSFEAGRIVPTGRCPVIAVAAPHNIVEEEPPLAPRELVEQPRQWRGKRPDVLPLRLPRPEFIVSELSTVSMPDAPRLKPNFRVLSEVPYRLPTAAFCSQKAAMLIGPLRA